jgi:hypothetical protein
MIIIYNNFGKLLGHIVSKEGMLVDPYKIKVIRDMEPLVNPCKIKSFLGHIWN